MNKSLCLSLAASLAVLIGCCVGCAPSASGSGASPSSESSGLIVGIVFDSGGRGDKSFNDSAYAGIEKAKTDLHIPEPKMVDSKSEKDYAGNLEAMAQSGCNLVFAVGYSQAKALEEVAPKYPTVKFAIIDTEVSQPNVRSLLFKEEEGSFLAGCAAALVSKTGKIGFVGGVKGDLIKKFETGYRAGALTINPNIDVLPAKYTESWDDAGLGKTAANVLFNDGADVVYHAAGRCGGGVIDAAKEAGKYAIGVDSDQDDVAPGTVLTSMIKHVDTAVFQTIKDVQDGKFTAGTIRYDLKDGGVGLSDFKYTKDKIGKDVLPKIDLEAQLIKDGKIVVPSKLEDLDAYLKTVKR